MALTNYLKKNYSKYNLAYEFLNKNLDALPHDVDKEYILASLLVSQDLDIYEDNIDALEYLSGPEKDKLIDLYKKFKS